MSDQEVTLPNAPSPSSEVQRQDEGNEGDWVRARAGGDRSSEGGPNEASELQRAALRLAAFSAFLGLVAGVLAGALVLPRVTTNRMASASTPEANGGSAAAIPVKAVGILADPGNWVPSNPGAHLAIEGNGVRLSRSTPATAEVRFAPDKTSDWSDYRVASRVSGLRDDIADGSAAVEVLSGSGSPIEVRLDNDRVQLVQSDSDGQELILADRPIPFAASHEVEVEVSLQNLSANIDGKSVFSGVLPNVKAGQSRRGGIALVAHSSARDNEASFLFDDLRVTPR